jgi:hypothetical protein
LFERAHRGRGWIEPDHDRVDVRVLQERLGNGQVRLVVGARVDVDRIPGASALISIAKLPCSMESAMLTASKPAPLIAPNRRPPTALRCNAPAI